MADPYSSEIETAISPGKAARVITPSGSDIDPVAKSLLVLATGNITFVPVGNADGDSITITGAPAGAVIPIRVRRVTSGSVAAIDQ